MDSERHPHAVAEIKDYFLTSYRMFVYVLVSRQLSLKGCKNAFNPVKPEYILEYCCLFWRIIHSECSGFRQWIRIHVGFIEIFSG